MEHSTEILSLPLAGPDPVQRDLSLAEVVTRIRSHAGRGMLPGPARAYSQVSAVYACVKAKADALSQMPMMVSTVDDEVIESGPLVQ